MHVSVYVAPGSDRGPYGREQHGSPTGPGEPKWAVLALPAWVTMRPPESPTVDDLGCGSTVGVLAAAPRPQLQSSASPRALGADGAVGKPRRVRPRAGIFTARYAHVRSPPALPQINPRSHGPVRVCAYTRTPRQHTYTSGGVSQIGEHSLQGSHAKPHVGP